MSTIEKRYDLMKKFLFLKNRNHKIIFIDETSIDEKLIPSHGYSEKGKKFVINVKPAT